MDRLHVREDGVLQNVIPEGILAVIVHRHPVEPPLLFHVDQHIPQQDLPGGTPGILLDHAVDIPLEDVVDQFMLILEIVIERVPAHPAVFRDVPDRDSVDRLCFHELQDRFDKKFLS